MSARTLIACAASLALALPAAAQVPNWPDERPPRPLAAKDVKFPPYQIRTLPNGLQVIAVSHHEQPAVSLRLIVRAGAAQDPENRPGLASLAASLLDQGTTTKTAEQVAQSIDSIGGAMGVGAGSDMTQVFAAVMKNSLDVGLDIISDVARNPAFAPEEIERQRDQTISAMKVSYQDPDYLAGAVFDRLVYGFHPYGKPDAGTPESLAAISREDLQAFHRRWFGPNNAILAIVGDVTAEQAFAGAERAFGKWGRIEVPSNAAAEVPPPTRRVVVIDRPGAVQTEIRVGHIGLPRKHKDFLALDLALKILGGEGGNRLHRVLRSERGLTYGAEADIHALKDAGDIVASTDTRSETTAEALRLIVDEIGRLRRERVHPRELGDAQAYLTGSFPLTIETPGAIALQVLNAVVYGLDLEELQTYRERVNSITPEDIQRVAQLYLHPDRLSIVLVGDAGVFAKQLPAVGFDQVERIPLEQLDLSSADLRTRPRTAPGRANPQGTHREIASDRGNTEKASHRGNTEKANHSGNTEKASHRGNTGETQCLSCVPVGARLIRASYTSGHPAQVADARSLIDKAIAAKGGLSLLKSIQTVKSATDMVFATPTGEAKVTATAYVRYPGQFRVDARGPDGLRIQTFDNGTAWVGDGREFEDAPAVIIRAMEASVQRDTLALLLALADKRVPSRRVADVTVDGEAMPALEVQLESAGRVTLVFHPATSLLVQQRYGGDAGEPATEESFTDYRPVQGLQVAHRATLRRDKNPPFERIVRSFEINVPLEAAFFKKPPSNVWLSGDAGVKGVRYNVAAGQSH